MQMHTPNKLATHLTHLPNSKARTYAYSLNARAAHALAYLVLAAQQKKWTPLSHFSRGAKDSGVGAGRGEGGGRGRGGEGVTGAVSEGPLSEADTRQLLLMLEGEDLILQKHFS